MRRVISVVLLVICVSLFASSAMSQKSKLTGPPLQVIAANSAKATSFANAAAYSDGTAVWLEWQMEVEVGNIGFNVYRSGSGGVELLTQVKMVPGAALAGSVAPISSRCLATASSPSSTCTTTGAETIYSTSSS